MKTYNGIKYAIKKTGDGLLLVIPKFNIHKYIDNDFKESELLNYI